MERGTLGLDRAAAASGGVLSGAQAQALSDYTQGTSNQYMQGAYGDYANRLAALAGIGQSANTGAQIGNMLANQAGAAGQYGANAANLMTQAGGAGAAGLLEAGNLAAAGQMGSGRAWQNALNNLSMLPLYSQFMGGGGLFGGGGGVAHG